MTTSATRLCFEEGRENSHFWDAARVTYHDRELRTMLEICPDHDETPKSEGPDRAYEEADAR